MVTDLPIMDADRYNDRCDVHIDQYLELFDSVCKSS